MVIRIFNQEVTRASEKRFSRRVMASNSYGGIFNQEVKPGTRGGIRRRVMMIGIMVIGIFNQLVTHASER